MVLVSFCHKVIIIRVKGRRPCGAANDASISNPFALPTGGGGQIAARSRACQAPPPARTRRGALTGARETPDAAAARQGGREKGREGGNVSPRGYHVSSRGYQTFFFIEMSIETGILLGGKHEASFVGRLLQ